MDQTSQSRTIGLLLGAGGSALFSLKAIVLKLAFAEGGTVEQMMALRMGIALPVFLAVGLWSYKKAGAPIDARMIALAAMLGVVSYYVCTRLDFTGLQYVSAQLERLILFLYPTITALLAWIFLKDRITWNHAAALILSYAGVMILAFREFTELGTDVAFGSALIFLAAALFAGYVVAAKPVISKIGSSLFTSIAMTAASVIILTQFATTTLSAGAPAASPNLWMLGAILAIACTVLPSFMVTEAIARVGPGLTSAIGGLGPAATAFFAVLILGEPFGWPHIIALTLTMAGLFLLSRAAQPTQQKLAGIAD